MKGFILAHDFYLSILSALIIRCLDALTREDDISNLFQNKLDVKVRQCHVMRDELTLTSRCYAFVELPTVADAYKVIDSITKSDQIFEIGGKAVTVNYAKNTYNTIMASLKAEGSYNAQLASSRGLTIELAQVAALHAVGNAPVSSTTLAINAVAASALLNPHVSQQAQTAQLSQLQQQQLVEEKAKQYHHQIAAVVHGTDHVPSSVKLTTSPTSSTSQPTTLPSPTMPFSATTCATTVYPQPDTSQFLYDESTRYYYDPVTGLLYDANSTYFFDRVSSQYFFWDRSRCLYVPVPPTGLSIQVAAVDTSQSQVQLGVPAEAEQDNEHVKKKIEKEKKEKTAKKIAKEMEKWAKRMNSQKEALATVEKTENTNNSSSRTADIGCALLEASLSSASHNIIGSNIINNAPASLASSLVASYGEGEESDDGNISPVASSGLGVVKSAAEVKVAEEEARLLDWAKLACLLCSRGFKDVATLQKHKAFSSLHLTNLNKLRAKYDLPSIQSTSSSNASTSQVGPSNDSSSTAAESLSIDALLQLGAVTASNHAKNAAARHRIASEQASALAQAVYRDRAKERRDRYGTSSPPRRRKRTESPPSPPPTQPIVIPPAAAQTATNSADTASANVGSRLMEKMGWQAGQGLGRANQGRTQIIEAEFREHGVGLGVKNSKRGPPSDNYKDNVKRAMFARFHELE